MRPDYRLPTTLCIIRPTATFFREEGLLTKQSKAPRLPTTDHFMHHPAYGHQLPRRRLTDEAVKSVLTTDHRLLKKEKLSRTFAGELFVFISLLG